MTKNNCTLVNIISDIKLTKDTVSAFIKDLSGDLNICKIDLVDSKPNLNISGDFLDTECCSISAHPATTPVDHAATPSTFYTM